MSAVYDFINVNSQYGLPLFVIGLFYTLLIAVCLWVKKRYNGDQKCRRCQRNIERNYHDRVDDVLKNISEKIKFNDDTQRISVYSYDSGMGSKEPSFTLLGRFSKNPVYKQFRRGRIYPVGQGVIWEAWKNGSHFVDVVPDPQDRDQYIKFHTDLNVSESIAQTFSMQSRWYFACAVDGVKKERIAVIVCESTKEKAFAKDDFHKKLLILLCHLA